MKVMTSFGYEITLTRGFWFQTLDVNKHGVKYRRTACFGVHTFVSFFLITPRQYEEEKFCSNETALF